MMKPGRQDTGEQEKCRIPGRLYFRYSSRRNGTVGTFLPIERGIKNIIEGNASCVQKHRRKNQYNKTSKSICRSRAGTKCDGYSSARCNIGCCSDQIGRSDQQQIGISFQCYSIITESLSILGFCPPRNTVFPAYLAL